MRRITITSYLIIVFIFILLSDANGQVFIIKSKKGVDAPEIEKIVSKSNFLRESQYSVKQIFKSPSLFRLTIIQDSDEDIIPELSPDQLNKIDWIAEDLVLQSRDLPDDTFLEEQWYLGRIKAIETWNISMGEKTINGDTIVLGILDDGFYSKHEDLVDNLWRNYGEIPGDGIDNDQNGYIDDFEGLNVANGTDLHTVREHGTAVAGIAGASGNNGIGIAGVSWNVKLLLISETNALSNVIEGYQYVLDMRKAYNESNGASGAYIVATNLSAGINSVFPEDNPLFQEWCSIYDALGEEGVLSVNATTNSDTNIDVEGDMPGTCPSPFLITVTNSDISDNKVIDAGYGVNFVDLSAPGMNILTTDLADEYDSFNGASSSAPQVSGAIALLYGADCETFGSLIIDNPEEGANLVKSLLMSGVDKFDDLGDKVKSGGRLNVFNAMGLLRDYCGGSTGELQIEYGWPNPVKDHFNLKYESENYEPHFLEIHDVLGRLIYQQEFHPDYFGEKIIRIDWIKMNIPQGVYFVSLRYEKDIESIKVLVRY